MADNGFLSDALNSLKESGCSTFFLTSSILSLINGKQNRKNSMDNAIQDETFQRELQRQKDLYDDKKEAEDRAFKLWLKNRQREFSRIEASKKLENDLVKEELKMFIKDWPLRISVEAINEKRKKSSTGAAIPLNIVVGKHYIGKGQKLHDDLYSQMVDELKVVITESGIPESNIYRFKDENTVIGGAALANIFAMMCNMPTAVILPKIDDDKEKFSISIGYWNQDSLFPMQKKVFELDYNNVRMMNDRTYLLGKKKEIIYSYTTIVMVLNDTHLLLENCSRPKYPMYAQNNNIKHTHPILIDFAKKEYASLDFKEDIIAKCDADLSEDVNMSVSDWSRVRKFANEAINQLN